MGTLIAVYSGEFLKLLKGLEEGYVEKITIRFGK